MVFSDTSTNTGAIQRCEKLTGLGYTGISGSTPLLQEFTAYLNDAFDELMPLLLSYTNDTIHWDDTNHTDLPIGTIGLVSGQADYTITTDDNSLDILDIKDATLQISASATDYTPLERMTADDPRALEAMSPNAVTGTPTAYLKMGNTLFLYPKPNYTNATGLKLFFERIESYFLSTDTTKAAGIPRIFHPLLTMLASHMWLIINKPAEQMLITRLESKIVQAKQDLKDLVAKRNPTRARMTPAFASNK